MKLSEVKILNFRCFDELEVRDLGQINLIFGENDTGKTSFIEAIYFLTNIWNQNLAHYVLAHMFREIGVSPTSQEVFVTLFKNLDASKSAVLGMNTSEGEEVKVEIQIAENAFDKMNPVQKEYFTKIALYPKGLFILITTHNGKMSYLISINPFSLQVQPQPQAVTGSFLSVSYALPFILLTEGKVDLRVSSLFFPTLSKIFQDDLVRIFGNIVKEGRKQEVVQILKDIAQIEDINTITFNERQILGIKRNGNYLPLNLEGEGIQRILWFILSIVEGKHKIILIDELENGLHWRIQEKFFKNLLELSEKYEVQIFATTHSWEVVKNLVNVCNNLEKIRGIRFFKQNGKIMYDILFGAELKKAVELQIEFR